MKDTAYQVQQLKRLSITSEGDSFVVLSGKRVLKKTKDWETAHTAFKEEIRRIRATKPKTV